MKQVFFAYLSLFLCILLPFELEAQSKNGTVQMPNMGFEEWDNLGKDDVEPKGWNSFMTANASGIIATGKQKKVDRDVEKRPGSKGSYSARIWSTAILGVNANGNMTTGKINMGSMTATNPSNHNFTIRSNSSFSIPFAAIPDSLVVWIKFEPKSAGDFARIACLIHNDEDVKDPGSNNGQVAAEAILNYPKTNGWLRFSIPFVKGGSSDPRYMLFSLTTNKTPGEGSDGDKIYVDDLLFIYNPTLSPRTLNSLSYGVSENEPTPINIPFTITGTMSPNNLEADNEVRAELSDINGSFANPTILGRLTTDESGIIEGSIPPGIPPGSGYRIRLVSTNYPLISASTPELEIYPVYKLEANAVNHRGTVIGTTGFLRAGTAVNLTANARFANHFTHWSEGGKLIPDAAANYKFTLNQNRNLVAHFDTNTYTISLAISGKGNVSGNEGELIHGSTVSLRAKAEVGYKFVEYTKNGNRISTNPNYNFPITEDLSLGAVFEPENFTITTNSNNTNLGSVSGGGSFSYMSEVTLTASPKSYCEFVAWISNGDTVSKNAIYVFPANKAANYTALFRETFYTVNCELSPANAGITKGQGQYSGFVSQTITLTAIPNEGYSFYRWEKKNTQPPLYYPNATYSIITNGRIGADADYIAHFRRIGFDINATAIPSQGGRIEGADNYPFGETATLTAKSNVGYTFESWKEGNTLISSSETYSFIVNAARNLNAVFSLNTYNIEVTSNNNDMGRVSGAGTFEHFNTIEVEAIANEAYEFRAWVENGDTVSKNAKYTFTVNTARELEAIFSYKRKKLTIIANPSGTGSFEGGGLHEHMSVVTLTPKPSQGYEFYAWVVGSDTISKDKNIAITLDKDSTIVGCFKPLPYTVTISSIDLNGSVSSDKFPNKTPQLAEGTLFFGDTVTIKAEPLTEGYVFTKWAANNKTVSNEEEYSFTLKENIALVAYFSNKTKFIDVELIPSNTATINNAGNQEIDNIVLLEVLPNTGYEFVEWTTKDDQPIGNDVIFGFEHSRDTAFKAILRLKTYSIEVQSIPIEAGSCSGEGTYSHFDSITLHTQANYGYSFLAWLYKGDTISKQETLKVDAKESGAYTAVFAKNKYTISLSQHPENAGLLDGEGIYNYKDIATLKAVPNYGLHFVAWVCDRDTLSKKHNVNLSVYQDSTIMAIFDTNLYEIKLLTNGSAQMGTVEGGRMYTYADTVKLIAHPKYGYHFSRWTDAQDKILGEDSILFFTASRDSVITAHFSANEFSVNADLSDAKAGAIEGLGSYAYLENIRLKAVPSYGYRFKKWTHNGSDISSYPIFEFVITKDTQLLAHFEIDSFYIRTLSNLEDVGTISGAGKYTYDSIIELSAIPNYGYTFSHWSIGGVQVSDNALYKHRVEKSEGITANFKPMIFTVSTLVQPSEECGEIIGAASYNYGDTVKLEAVEKPDFHFVEWRNAHHWVSNDAILKFIITKDTLFTAIYQTDTFTVSVTPNIEQAGKVSGSGKFTLYTPDTLFAQANKGYRFLYWEKEGQKYSEENPHVFIIEETMSYTAVFERISYTMTANASPNAGGIVSGTGNYFYGDTAYLEAITDPIYNFREWVFTGESVIDPGESVVTFDTANLRDVRIFFIMKSDVEIQAKFAKKTYPAMGLCSTIDAGEILNSGNYEHGTKVRLEVIPKHGYKIINWDLDGQTISDSSICEFEITKPSLAIANFVPKSYTVSISAYPEEAGILSGSGSYFFGDTVSVSTTIESNYTFDEWVDDNAKTFGRTPTITFIVKDNTYLTALFSEKVDMEESKILPAYRLYPNPFHNELYLQGEGFSRIEIYNLMGQKVLESFLNSTKQSLDISHLHPGFFVYRLYGKDGSLQTGKLIKE